MSTPPASACTCGFWPTPPKIDGGAACPARGPAGRRRRRPGWPARGSAPGSASAAAWAAACWSEAASRATSGRLKARVLPEPVRPRPSTSRPARRVGQRRDLDRERRGDAAGGEHLDQRARGRRGRRRWCRWAARWRRRRRGRRPAPGRRRGAGLAAGAGRCCGAARSPARAAAATAAAAASGGDGRPPVPGGGRVADVAGRSHRFLRRSGGRHVHLGERERRRTCTGAGRAHIVGETSDSRAHLGGAASARRRFLPLRMSEGGAGTSPLNQTIRPALVRRRGVAASHRVSDAVPR